MSGSKIEIFPCKTTARGEIVRKLSESKVIQERMKKEALDAQRQKDSSHRAEKLKNKACTKDDEKENESIETERFNRRKRLNKPLKKSIPIWASVSAKKTREISLEKPTYERILQESLAASMNDQKYASLASMKKYTLQKYPYVSNLAFKMALRKGINSGVIERVKGLSGSFRSSSQFSEQLDTLLPHVFTWITEPKKASFTNIKKYIQRYFSTLDTEGKGFKRALENGVSKGQLIRVSGRGVSGSFALVHGAKKTGTAYEDAIEDAILATTEPKNASVISLKSYLSRFHIEYKIQKRPFILKKCLERLEAKGHVLRVSGKGFTGTFRLGFPYTPSPRELWRDNYEESKIDSKQKNEKKKEIKGSFPSKMNRKKNFSLSKSKDNLGVVSSKNTKESKKSSFYLTRKRKYNTND